MDAAMIRRKNGKERRFTIGSLADGYRCEAIKRYVVL